MSRIQERPPVVIQGGMGVGVSSWRLASAVARSGQLGIVSGTALDTVLARRLQDGDPDGEIREAIDHFPLPEIGERVVQRHWRAGGRAGAPYAPVPRLGLRGNRAGEELLVVGAFVEVWLAKRGHDGLIGINLLEKIQMATPGTVYGAVLAGVDAVAMGAGIPRELPALLDAFAEHRPGTITVDVKGGDAVSLTLDPADLGAGGLDPVARPPFLAIVSSHILAQFLARNPDTRPDGFVVEAPDAGGHNAPPRGRVVLDDAGEPVYGPRDAADLSAMVRLGLPFWLAGGYGDPRQVRAALDAGAAGVQVGTLFALSQESGLLPELRRELLDRLRAGTLTVRTDPVASPTGFPFKVAELPGTLADPAVRDERPRLCDLGYLRQPYARPNGAIGYRCPAEPVDVYVRKGGDAADCEGAQCLCNALTSDVGLAQNRRDGYDEPPLLTLGSDLDGARLLDAERRAGGHERPGWTAAEAIAWLLQSSTVGSTAD